MQVSRKVYFPRIDHCHKKVGEVRIQFHVVTDGHDRMKTFNREFIKTMHALWSKSCGTSCSRSDNPAGYCDFFLQEFPSLQANQINLNLLGPRPTVDDAVLPKCSVEMSIIKVCCIITEINSYVEAAQNSVKHLPQHLRVMSLDAEWDIEKTLTGMIMGQGSVSVIQLSYIMEPEGKVHALVIQLLGSELPSCIIDLLKTVILFLLAMLSAET